MSGRILIVDDEPINLKLLEALLVPRGFEVVKAANGREALDRIREEKIDIVLLDVMMPEMNGYDVCRKIKEDDHYRHIPVVMITALHSKDDRIKSIEAGAEDFISKPFDQEEVLARIKMLHKVKNLNDRLNQAYANINALTEFGENMIADFDPLNYDLFEGLEKIVGQLIRKNNEASGKPETLVLRVSGGEAAGRLVKYDFHNGSLHKVMFTEGYNLCLSEQAGSEPVTFCDKADLGQPVHRPHLKMFRSIGIEPRNYICFSSPGLCIHALNYGGEVSSHDSEVLNNFVMQSLFLKSLSGQIKETDDAFAYTVHALARAAEVNDEDTGNHILRVGEYCSLIAEHLGMPAKFIGIIKLQALMHDVGKIHIPPEILKKPGKLTQEEFELVKQHPLYGSKIIGDHVRLTMAKEIALAHHERWDGGGYPYGLKEDQIPLTGRILNIADIYDALRNKRVYKPAFDHDATLKIITEGDGRTMPSHFDPRILQAFRETATRFEEIYEKMQG